MQADLFSARDAAALLAIRQLLDEGRLSRGALRAVFTAAGLMREMDEAGPQPMQPLVGDRSGGHAKRAA
ncbi:MAG TPA: hypothetical protein VIN75_07800 [Burkholderiaceae bacterium]